MVIVWTNLFFCKKFRLISSAVKLGNTALITNVESRWFLAMLTLKEAEAPGSDVDSGRTRVINGLLRYRVGKGGRCKMDRIGEFDRADQVGLIPLVGLVKPSDNFPRLTPRRGGDGEGEGDDEEDERERERERDRDCKRGDEGKGYGGK